MLPTSVGAWEVIGSEEGHGHMSIRRPRKRYTRVCIGLRTFSSQSCESIQRQLSLKGGEPSVTEEVRHYLCNESLGFMDMKGSTMGLPADNMRETLSFGFIKHMMQDSGKHRTDSPTAFLFQCWKHEVPGQTRVIMILMLHLGLIIVLVI